MRKLEAHRGMQGNAGLSCSVKRMVVKSIYILVSGFMEQFIEWIEHSLTDGMKERLVEENFEFC